jgi:isopenicillin-N N-acyltransferase-like protein
LRDILAPHRAAGYNHLLAHDSGEMYNVEVSAHHFAMLYDSDGSIAHTNHYLDYQMVQIENESDELISTRVRYYRALRLLKQSTAHTVASLQAIQRDHVNYPDSICNHSELGDPLDREKTIMGLIIDLTARQMHAVWGNPCENNYAVYQLDD